MLKAVSQVMSTLLAMLVLAGLAGQASAQDTTSNVESTAVVDPLDIPPENDPLARAFDRPRERGGFYLRLSTSIGAHNTRLGPAPWEDAGGLTAHGFGSGFGLDVGVLIAPWLAVHGNMTLGVLWNGNVHDQHDISGTSARARVLAYGVAPAATFFTPNDFRVTTALGVGMATVQQRSGDDTTDPGFYMNLVAGKDFVVSPNFALGLQFQVVYMLLGNDPNHDEARVRQFLFGLSGAFDSI